MRARRGSFLVVAICVFAALLLTVMPLPAMLDWVRPSFPLLVVIYWAIALPDRYGTWFGWVVGLLLDTLRATPFGTHALAFAVAGYAANQLTARMKVYPTLQQIMVVALLCGVAVVVMRVVGNLTDTTTATSLAVSLLPVLSTALLWPWAMAFQDRLRRAFHAG
jgi:rod shape-determining protein MreD